MSSRTAVLLQALSTTVSSANNGLIGSRGSRSIYNVLHFTREIQSAKARLFINYKSNLSLRVNKGQMNAFTVQKPRRLHLNQMIEVNTPGTSDIDGMCPPIVTHYQWYLTSVCSSNNVQPQSNHKKTSDKPQLSLTSSLQKI